MFKTKILLLPINPDWLLSLTGHEGLQPEEKIKI
jgi:hypothetical protein